MILVRTYARCWRAELGKRIQSLIHGKVHADVRMYVRTYGTTRSVIKVIYVRPITEHAARCVGVHTCSRIRKSSELKMELKGAVFLLYLAKISI